MVGERKWVWGIDVSFSLIPSVEWARRRIAEGIVVMVQDLWTGGYQGYPALCDTAPINLRLWREAGGVTAGYICASPYYPPETSMAKGQAAAGTEWNYLSKVFNDVELDRPEIGYPISEYQIHQTSRLIEAAGKGGDIYTARWFWSKIGNPTWPWLKDYRLWNANYDGDSDIDFGSASYGPWTVDDLVGEQWRGSHILDGVEVDANIFDLNYFQAQQEDDLTDQDVIKVITDLKDGEFVVDGYIVWQVSRPAAADYPILRRVDNSNAAIISSPRSIPLLVSAYLQKGPDI